MQVKHMVGKHFSCPLRIHASNFCSSLCVCTTLRTTFLCGTRNPHGESILTQVSKSAEFQAPSIDRATISVPAIDRELTLIWGSNQTSASCNSIWHQRRPHGTGTYALVALTLCAVLIATGTDSDVPGSDSGASRLLPACCKWIKWLACRRWRLVVWRGRWDRQPHPPAAEDSATHSTDTYTPRRFQSNVLFERWVIALWVLLIALLPNSCVTHRVGAWLAGD